MKKVAIMAIMAFCFCLVGGLLASEAGTGVTEQDFKSFLKDYEAKVIPLSIAGNQSYFDAAISGKDAAYEKSAQDQIALEKIYTDTAAFARIKAFRSGGLIIDPLLKRQLDVLYLAYLGGQIDPKIVEDLVKRSSAIEQKFNTYRTKIGDKVLSDNQIDSILKSSTNSVELEATWKASKQIGREVAADLIALVKLRNQAAKSLGFANFYEMQMKLGEQEPAEIAALYDQLDSLTRGAFAVLKGQIDSALAIRDHIPAEQLRPWHYQDRFFQEAPSIYNVDLDAFYKGKDPVALTRAFYAGIGTPVDSILAHSDLYEKPGKYQHAECMDFDKVGNVRVIANVRPNCYWMNTMLHEVGHGIYSYYNDRQLPWTLRDAAHAFTTEGIAEFFERLATNPEWLEKVAGVPKVDVDKVAGDMVKMTRLEQMVFSRWSQVMVRFERGMYENPDQDLNKLWWDLVEKYQGLTRPEGRNEPDWASKIHIATTPVYYHNYLIAELFASQLAETIGRKVLGSSDPFSLGFAGDPRIGKYLVDNIFKPGMRYPWNEMIERATGEKLTSLYYAKQFVGAK